MLGTCSCFSQVETPTPTPSQESNGPAAEIINRGMTTPATTVISKHQCSSLSKSLNTNTELGINAVSRIQFTDENTLRVEGWGTRAPAAAPTATRDPQTDPHAGSHQVAFRQGQYDLANGTSTLLTPPAYSLLLDPCSGSCPAEVFSQSPDGQWQLVQVYDSSPPVEGIWLVSSTHKLRLLEFIPFSSIWQWMADSSLLWYQHSAPIYGFEAIIVQLESAPIVTHQATGRDNVLDPNFYHVAVSPSEMTALSTTNPYFFDVPDIDDLNTVDLAPVAPQRTSVEHVPGIAKVEWNEATQSYLLILHRDEVVEVREQGGLPAVQLALNLFDDYIAKEALPYALPFRSHALSSSGRHLAVEYVAHQILVFDCS